MKVRGALFALVAVLVLAIAVPASAGTGLNAYKAKARGAKQLRELKKLGFDVTEGQRRRGIEIVATKAQIRKLRKTGIRAKLLRDRRGRTARRAVAAQAAGGWEVWRPYARTDVEVSGAAGNPTANIMTQLENLATAHPNITKLETIGHTIKGLPIYAMKVTKDADTTEDGTRPAVLYSSVQHAREWLAGETGRRTLRLFLDNYGRTDDVAIGTDGKPVAGVLAREITRLVNTRELWFILIANPDGYDFTFDPENRLWRKNLHDNNEDEAITAADGVDLNRNFPTNWNYDDEGSNTERSSETYRGLDAASEPETQAFLSLMNRVHFAYNKNDHTFGRLLLWPPGWQVDTRYADEPIMTALAGDDRHPGVDDFDPDVGAELYTTNGDTNDHMYTADHVISYTPEGSPGIGTGSGFIFQDVEKDVQEEFERHVEFALDIARSADDPSRPDGHLGIKAPNFVPDTFNVSYGDPQTVQVNARRDLGAIQVKYRVNNGRIRTASTDEWEGGLRYGDVGDHWYRRMRGQVTGTDPGDKVEVWFYAPEEDVQSKSFVYTVRSDSGARVLVLAVEDYSGFSAIPAYPDTSAPNYLSYHTAALQANGIDYDVYDYDAMDRKAPDPLGVLSHYDAVVWYTGNDNVTRSPNVPGVADLEAHRTITAVRDFVNEGGRVALEGVNAGRQFDLVEYPQEGYKLTQCDGDLATTDDGKCQPLSNDFAQYYLGSYVRADAGGLAPDGSVLPVTGLAAPLDSWNATLNDPAQSAGNHSSSDLTTGTHLVTSSILHPDTYPQFASEQAADWVTEGDKPFDPHTGEWYMTSQNINEGYKRLRRTIDLTALTEGQPASLSFFTSYNTEQDWDFVFVEAQTLNPDTGAGNGDWDTLPDANDHTSDDTGESCAAGWSEELHNHLRHYTTYDPTANGGAGGCTSTGTTGDWNADSGNSGGWQEWNIDLSAYHGKRVEISIVFATDWATLQVPGALVDDTKVTVNGAVTDQTSFETDMGGWDVPGAHPEGPSTNLNDWIRSQRIFEDAAVTKSRFGLFFGFGLEGVNGADNRRDLMKRTVDYLLAG